MSKTALAFAAFVSLLLAVVSGEAQQKSSTQAGKAQAPEFSDHKITLAIQEKFTGRAEFQHVAVQTKGGVVTLDGTVPTKHERRALRDLVRGIPGVKKVKDNVRLRGGGVAGAGVMAKAPPDQIVPPANTAGSIAGNTKAESGTQKGTGAMAQAGSSTTSPPTTAGTHPGPAESAAGSRNAGTAPQSAPKATASAGSTPPGTPAQQSQPGANSPANAPQESASGARAPQQPGQQPQQTPAAAAGSPLFRGADAQTVADQIQTAFKNDARLTGITVTVSGDDIDLTGKVANGRDKDTALRLAQSYAVNRRIVDHVTVAGREAATPPPSEQKPESQEKVPK